MHTNSKRYIAKKKNHYLDSLSQSSNTLFTRSIRTRATLILAASIVIRGTTATASSPELIFHQSTLSKSLGEIVEPRRETRLILENPDGVGGVHKKWRMANAFPYSVIPSFRPLITELNSGSVSPTARVYYLPPQPPALRQYPHRFVHVDKAIPFGHPNAEPNEEIVNLLNVLNRDRTDENIEREKLMEMARPPRVRRNINSIHLPLKRYACRFKFCRIYDV